MRGGAFRPWDGAPAELELGARLADFLALMRADMDADTLFFQRRLRISGDTELGLIVKNWLDASPRPAWLDKLARWGGRKPEAGMGGWRPLAARGLTCPRRQSCYILGPTPQRSTA